MASAKRGVRGIFREPSDDSDELEEVRSLAKALGRFSSFDAIMVG